MNCGDMCNPFAMVSAVWFDRSEGEAVDGNRDDFADWRDRIESRVTTLEVTVATQARVRAGMDQDLSELKVRLDVQHRTLQALGTTQSEHSALLREHSVLLREHSVLLRDHTDRLGRLEAGQATLLAGVQTIIGLLDQETSAGE